VYPVAAVVAGLGVSPSGFYAWAARQARRVPIATCSSAMRFAWPMPRVAGATGARGFCGCAGAAACGSGATASCASCGWRACGAAGGAGFVRRARRCLSRRRQIACAAASGRHARISAGRRYDVPSAPARARRTLAVILSICMRGASLGGRCGRTRYTVGTRGTRHGLSPTAAVTPDGASLRPRRRLTPAAAYRAARSTIARPSLLSSNESARQIAGTTPPSRASSSTLKTRGGAIAGATHAEAATAIGVLHRSVSYNPERLHSTLGYHAPVAFEEGRQSR
jgi:hypothetical protein